MLIRLQRNRGYHRNAQHTAKQTIARQGGTIAPSHAFADDDEIKLDGRQVA
jgi:hypothetical protein